MMQVVALYEGKSKLIQHIVIEERHSEIKTHLESNKIRLSGKSFELKALLQFFMSEAIICRMGGNPRVKNKSGNE